MIIYIVIVIGALLMLSAMIMDGITYGSRRRTSRLLDAIVAVFLTGATMTISGAAYALYVVLT